MEWNETPQIAPKGGDLIVLVGEYDLSLDGKGRLSVPAGLRHILRELYGPEEGNSLFITKYFENCLVVYPKLVWADIQEQVNNLPNDAKSRSFIRSFFSSASVSTLDRQGRILVPQKLRQSAGIGSEAHLMGVGRKLELWSPTRWEAYEANQPTDFELHEQIAALKL
jgi:MraZ protein